MASPTGKLYPDAVRKGTLKPVNDGIDYDNDPQTITRKFT